MSQNTLKVATRGSPLALAQTRQTVDALAKRTPGIRYEIVILKTTGDRVTDRPLNEFRGTGVFVKELEAALLNGKADLAVHSLKDMPSQMQEGLELAGFPERAKASDLLLTRDGKGLFELEAGGKVGTGSLRRIVQLKKQRSDLGFANLRGNLGTRIRKMEEGQYDAIVVAAAGMIRLGKEYPSKAELPFDFCLPAPGQGILGLECRKSDEVALQAARSINHARTELAAKAERGFMAEMGAGCSAPLAAHAHDVEGTLQLTGMIGDPKTCRIARCTVDVNDVGDASMELKWKLLEFCEQERISVPV